MPDPNRPDDADGPTTPGDEGAPGDESAARDEMARRAAEDQTELNIFDGVRAASSGPVLPVRLERQDMFCFSCHRGVACWNRCCYGADVTLTPYDIVALSRHLAIRPAELVERHAVPAMWEQAGLPVAKLKMAGEQGEGACPFLAEPEGCTVYDHRPATCRYYPLGLGAGKTKGADDRIDFHFLVKEAHCEGHAEDNLQTVAAFLDDQQVAPYERVNRGWMDILMKMASWRSVGGPYGKEVTAQAKKMFYMVSTDVDALRRFVFESRFLDTYYIEEDALERLRTDDEALLGLGFDWMKNVLFNEPTITMREDILQSAIATTRNELGGS